MRTSDVHPGHAYDLSWGLGVRSRAADRWDLPWRSVRATESPLESTHPLGRPWGDRDRRCGQCAWAVPAGPGPLVLRCQAAPPKQRGVQPRVSAEMRACTGFEQPLDCLECGACCREAFDAVEISRQDPVRRKHPSYVFKADGRYQIRRTLANRCSALGADLRCAIYADRPRCCRDFERHGPNCIFARRRVGLSLSWGTSR